MDITTSSPPHLSDLRIGFSILFSAFIYLFDYVTTILAAKDILQVEKQHPQQHNLHGIFRVLLCFLVIGHIGNALILFLTFPREEQPLFQAYFLPLVQLWRLAKLLWLTSTCKGLHSLESEIKPFYNIMSAALETSYQLAVQLYVSVFVPPSPKLALSLTVSFISLAYSGGSALLSVTNNGRNYKAAIAGGFYTFSSFVLRTLTCVVLTASQRSYHISVVWTLLAALLINFVNLWFVWNDWLSFGWHKVFRCVAYAYLGVNLGPLYSMLSEELEQRKKRSTTKPRKGAFRLKLCTAVLSHLSLDIIFFATCFCTAQNEVWWDGCDHGSKLLRYLKEPYWVIYTGKRICHIYVPRFVYGLLTIILSFAAFLALDDWWSREYDFDREPERGLEEEFQVRQANCNIVDSRQHQEGDRETEHDRDDSKYKMNYEGEYSKACDIVTETTERCEAQKNIETEMGEYTKEEPVTTIVIIYI